MPISIKVSDVWRTASSIRIKVSDSWRTVSQGYIKVSGAWRQFFPGTQPYTFYLGNTVHIGTNGYIAFDNGYSVVDAAGTLGRVLGILPADLLVNGVVRWAADSSKFYVFYRGKRLSGGSNFEIEYEVHFTNGQDYALIKLIAFPAITYESTAYYVDGSNTGYSTVASRTVGGEYRVYFDTTAAFSTTFTEYGTSTAALWLGSSTPTSGNLDDGYFTIVANQGSSAQAPTSVTASSITGTTATISWDAILNANAGMSAIQSYDYSTNSGSTWTSTSTSTSVNLTGLTGNTSYTVLVRANNYFFTGTNYGSVTFTTLSVPGTPTITFSSVTATGFTVTWSATNATSYNVQAFRSVSGATLTDSGGFTYPRNGTTATTATFTGLNGFLSHSVTVTGVNSAGTGDTFTKSLIGTAAITFASNTSTSDGFTGSVNNRDSAYTYSFAISTGTLTLGTASGSSYPFTVTGLSSGSSATVTVTSTRTDYFNGAGSTTGSAIAAASLSTIRGSTGGRIANNNWANPKATMVYTFSNVTSATARIQRSSDDITWTSGATETLTISSNSATQTTNQPVGTTNAFGNFYYRAQVISMNGTTLATPITSASFQNTATAKNNISLYP
jgi:hypothetical protein